MKQSNYERYTHTYGFKDLTNKHSLSDEGVWEIFGEDPNCDWGGHHSNPHLDTVSGKLEDVIRYAVDLRDFWQWGAGGEIKKKTEKKIVNVSDAMKNRKRIEELKAARDKIDKELKTLED
jgi:hypothetical protein